MESDSDQSMTLLSKSRLDGSLTVCVLAAQSSPEGDRGGGGSPMFTLANYRNRHTAHQSLLNCHQHNLLHFVVVSNLEVVTYTGAQPITVTAILLFHFISKQLSGLFNVITRATSATIY